MLSRLPVWLIVFSFFGCGYTNEEYQLQSDKLIRSVAKERAMSAKAEEAAADLDSAKERIAELENRMRALGIDLEDGGRPADLAATLRERERALAEHRARAVRTEDARARVEALRTKLGNVAGVSIRTRKNRVAVVLAPEGLFDKTRTKLSADGKSTLEVVADVIKSEPLLAARELQVACQTPAKEKTAPDASLASALGQARQIAVYLGDPKGGGLDASKLSAAGFGQADARIDLDAARCELIVTPAPSELYDLQSLDVAPLRVDAPVPPAPAVAPAVSAGPAPAKLTVPSAAPAPAAPTPVAPAAPKTP